METLDERHMAEIGCLDPVYIDGILGFTELGTNFGTVYFRLVPVRAENGLVVYEKTPVLYLIRPKAGASEMIELFARYVGAPFAPMIPPFNVFVPPH